MINYFQILFTVLLLQCSTTLSADPQKLFSAANEAYQKGDFQTAIHHYEAILETGNYSTEIYFNLGNAYYKTKNLGKAILHYEKALLISPGDEDTRFNLTIAKEQTIDRLETIGRFFLKEWWQSLHHLFSAQTWSILNLLSIWGGVAGIILWLFGPSRLRKKQGFIGGISLLVLSVLLFLIARSQSNFEKDSSYAIVLVKEIELKNGPDPESTGILLVHEGLKIELLDEIGNWQKVKLSNGDQGWLPSESMGKI